MEYHLTKKTISRLRYAADTVTEQAVDVDLSLPDYCPDIEKILSCTLIPDQRQRRPAEHRGQLTRTGGVSRR